MSGPFFLKWIATPVAFNVGTHGVDDENVFGFTMSHNEGEYPSLSIQIENPRVGLLSRPVWAWLSWDKAWVYGESHTPDIVPLFLGRLIGVPNSLNKAIITLDFISRPLDHAAQREALAETLRVLPYYDPLWVKADRWTDPDAVLEGYSKLWHFDRITGVVSVSDILVGEDGVEEYQASEIPNESVNFTLSQAPFRMVSVEGTAGWEQQFSGSVPITKGSLKTYTGGSLVDDWPENEKSLGSGYIARNSFCKDVWGTADVKTGSYDIQVTNQNEKHSPGDTVSASASGTLPLNLLPATYSGPIESIPYSIWPLTLQTDAGIGKASVNRTFAYIQKWFVAYQLEIGYEAKRGRTETANFVMQAHIQPVLSDEGEVEIHEIKVSSNNVDEPLPNEVLPIGDLARASFFETERGQQSLQYLMCLARSALIMASRCVEISATIPFERAIDLSCRKMAIINDPGLPGGQALGKVKEYSFTADGDTGEMIGKVVIASSIGYGDALEEEVGEPTYVAEGYVNVGYQQYAGQVVVIGTGDIAYEVPEFAGADDGLRYPLKKKDIVISETWHGSLAAQQAYIDTGALVGPIIAPGYSWGIGDEDRRTSQERLEEATEHLQTVLPTWYELKLKNINGKFTNAYNVTVYDLELPKQIDLEFTP